MAIEFIEVSTPARVLAQCEADGWTDNRAYYSPLPDGRICVTSGVHGKELSVEISHSPSMGICDGPDRVATDSEVESVLSALFPHCTLTEQEGDGLVRVFAGVK